MSQRSRPEQAEALLRRLVQVYGQAADPQRAAPMRAYMRDQFPFLGIGAPQQRVLARQVMTGVSAWDDETVAAVALGCWDLDEREYQYFGCQFLRRQVKNRPADLLDTVRLLILSKSWWDTVDTLAAHAVGPLVASHPSLTSTMDSWATDENPWLVRAALLHQLTYKQATDERRLFRYCAAQAEQPDFFIRKGIGWALREYSRVAPDAVRQFVAAHKSTLSGLSQREALRNLR